DHARTLEARGALGMALTEAGKLEGAEQTLRTNLESRRRARPDDSYGIALDLNNIALILMTQRRPQDAEPLFRESLRLMLSGGEQGRRDVHILQRNLGRALRATGRPAEAEPLFREALGRIRDQQGEKSWRYGNGLTGLALVLLDLERFEEALESATESEAVLEETLPDGHGRTANARGARGVALTALGRYAEAEEALLESHAAFEALADEESRRLEQAKARLVALYDAWGRPRDADPYRDGG
ncbi:MAG: tetratricopeptide repeat protein, partial [Acidobacteriota bacterium]